MAHGEHRGEELRFVPGHVHREFVEVAALGVAQPFAREDHDPVPGASVRRLRRGRRFPFQRAGERHAQVPAVQLAQMRVGDDAAVDLQQLCRATAFVDHELDIEESGDAEAAAKRVRELARFG